MLGLLHCFPALEHAVLNLCPLLLQPHTSIPPILPKWLRHNLGDIGTPCYNCYDFFICLVFCALIIHFFQPQTLPIVPGFLNTFIHIQLSINFIILKEVSPGTFWHFQNGRAALCSRYSGISPPSTPHPCCPAPHQLEDPFTSLLSWISCFLDSTSPCFLLRSSFQWRASSLSFLRKSRWAVPFSSSCLSKDIFTFLVWPRTLS